MSAAAVLAVALAALSPCCDARRPSPSIDIRPPVPRAGAPAWLTAASPGRGVTYAWDLDGDGAFDDAAGAAVVAQTRLARVRVTDEDGRAGVAERSLAAHEDDVAPHVVLRLPHPSPASTSPVEAQVSATDVDGRVTRIESDLDGDGEYELADEIPPGAAAEVEHDYRDPGAGRQTLHVRAIDDAGAATVVSAGLEVHDGDLAPSATLDAAPGAVRPGEPVTLAAHGFDPEGPVADYAFDLDGDGAYETDASGTPSAVARFGDAGSHEVGVRVTDEAGNSAVSRRTVRVAADGLPGANRAPALELAVPSRGVHPGVPADLRATAGDPDGDPVVLAWDADGDGAFDDGAGTGLRFAFPSPGLYRVRVRATDGRGGEGVELATVDVRDDAGVQPVVTALTLPAVIRAGRPVDVSAAAADPDDAAVALDYDLDGDGAFGDSPAGWTFTTPVTIAVRATDASGRSAIRTAHVRPVASNVGPVVALRPADLVAGAPVTVSAEGADPDGGTVALAWDADGDGEFDDGAGASLTLPPPVTGARTIAVRATDDDGAAAVASRSVTVGTRPPAASFTIDGTTLRSTASDPDGDDLAAFSWDLDDDGTFGDAAGTTATVAAGAHTVGLKVTDAGGDTGIAYAPVEAGLGEEPSATPTATATATAMATATATATATAAATPEPTPAATAVPAATAFATATGVPGATGPPAPVASPDRGAWPPSRDRVAPRVTFRVAAVSRARLLARGFPVTVACSERCRAMVVVSARSRVLGRSERRLQARGTVTVRLSPSGRALVRRARSLRARVRLTARDDAGNAAVSSRALTLRGERQCFDADNCKSR